MSDAQRNTSCPATALRSDRIRAARSSAGIAIARSIAAANPSM
jgi:hypothetical protein